jgi:hypothetical protein
MGRCGLLLGSLVGLTSGLGLFFLFFRFNHLVCYASRRLIAFDERSITRAAAYTGECGRVESSARADRVESDAVEAAGRKKVVGCGKERGDTVEDMKWVVCSSS